VAAALADVVRRRRRFQSEKYFIFLKK
jgi:hypothetical protein